MNKVARNQRIRELDKDVTAAINMYGYRSEQFKEAMVRLDAEIDKLEQENSNGS